MHRVPLINSTSSYTKATILLSLKTGKVGMLRWSVTDQQVSYLHRSTENINQSWNMGGTCLFIDLLIKSIFSSYLAYLYELDLWTFEKRDNIFELCVIFYRKEIWSFLKVLNYQIVEELINLRLKWSALIMMKSDIWDYCNGKLKPGQF